MVQILHYYCKPHREDLLNNITYTRGISCQIQTEYMDISDIVKELTNKNHIDCIVIDEALFGMAPEAEDIVSKLEVLKFVCANTQIMIIALDRFSNDEIISEIREKDAADCIITKDMSGQYERVISDFFDGNINSEVYDFNTKTEVSDENTATIRNTVIEEAAVPIEALSEEVVDIRQKSFLKSDIISFERDSESMVTIGICGLQPHIGATHHALAIARAISEGKKRVCYKESNNHDAYNILRSGSLAVDKQGYISIAGVDIFDRNAEIVPEKYDFCIIDYGYIGECRETDFFASDIPIIIAGAKDWEIHHFIGAYQSGILEKAFILMNFFPPEEQMDFQKAFPMLNIWFSEYSPEVFNPQKNINVYAQIINN